MDAEDIDQADSAKAPAGNQPPAAPETEPDADDAGAGMKNQLCVPLSSLAMPGEDDATTTPEAGDKGSVNVEYTVDRVEGDQAYINADAVNGNKIEAGEAGPPSEDDQMAELQKMAEGMPERY